MLSQTRKEAVDSANYNLDKKDYVKALSFANKSLELSEKEFGVNSEAYSRSLELIGHVYNYSGNYEKAIEYIAKKIII